MTGGYSVEKLNELIDFFAEAKRTTDDITDKLTSILVNELGSQGITGSIAEAVVNDFNATIKPIFEGFSETSQDFINRSQTFCENAEKNTQDIINIF